MCNYTREITHVNTLCVSCNRRSSSSTLLIIWPCSFLTNESWVNVSHLLFFLLLFLLHIFYKLVSNFQMLWGKLKLLRNSMCETELFFFINIMNILYMSRCSLGFFKVCLVLSTCHIIFIFWYTFCPKFFRGKKSKSALSQYCDI